MTAQPPGARRSFWVSWLVLHWLGLTTLLCLPHPFGSLGRTQQFHAWSSIVDPVGHLLGFGLLAFLAHCAFGLDKKWWAVLAAYAVASECAQMLFPPRTPDPWDVVVDLIGLLLGFLAAKQAWFWQGRKQSPA